ncbi:MAG: DUF885 domain-containing protein [Sinobacteraceae bacterium]|nr:DUF885 domain-containing protein [Nevskiaceae bacterium]
MTRVTGTRTLPATIAAWTLASPLAFAATQPEWVLESNRQATALLDENAKYNPEQAATFGVEGHDAEVFDAKPNNVQRQEADLDAVATGYERALATASDPRVKQDIEILLKSARDQRTTIALNDRLMLPYLDLPQALFNSFHGLLDPRVAKSRYPAAATRLKRYVGAERGYEPIATLVRARVEERLGDNSLTGPWIVEVQQNLQNQAQYLEGIRELFEKSGLKGWQRDFKTLSRQLDDYDKWVRSTIVPRARQTNRLPPEIYADNLKNYGVSMDPHELIDRALFVFASTRDEMQSIAGQIAQRRGLESADYHDVLRELKRAKIPNDKLLASYNDCLSQIEAIVRKEHLITIPERKAAIRLATDAESAQTPAPHLDLPRLIGNTGEPSEFVIPTSNPNAQSKAEMDDFNYEAIKWTLTAHEARPGHELQFAAMLEGGVSIARAIFAFNSANVEGWALYSEAFMKPYLPLDGQLASLQARLQRAARAFLDPMVNLGMIEPSAAKQVLMDEVLLSEPMAKQEIDRYTFRLPGQATAYFFGYTKLEALRAKTELALGPRFNVQAYHDFILRQGLLPPELLERAVTEEFVPSQKGNAGTS